MGNSGIIDWTRLDRLPSWTHRADGQFTFVFAFWLVDYGRSNHDDGVAVLKPGSEHPDWFLHAENADHVLAAYYPPKASVSPNYGMVFGDKLQTRPLLGSLLLATTDGVYERNGEMWWAGTADLTFRGRRLVKKLDRLYERPHHLVTFVEAADR